MHVVLSSLTRLTNAPPHIGETQRRRSGRSWNQPSAPDFTMSAADESSGSSEVGAAHAASERSERPKKKEKRMGRHLAHSEGRASTISYMWGSDESLLFFAQDPRSTRPAKSATLRSTRNVLHRHTMCSYL